MSDSSARIDFWLNVQEHLQKAFKMPADQARAALDTYRRLMESHGAIEAVYHWEPQDIARAIHGGRCTEANPQRRTVAGV